MGVNNHFPTPTEGQAERETQTSETGIAGAQTALPEEAAVTEATEAAATATSTAQPAPPAPGEGNSRLLWGGLAVAFALLAVAVVFLLRKKDDGTTAADAKPNRAASGSAPDAQTARATPVSKPDAQANRTTPVVASPAAPTPVQVAYYQHIGAREDQQDSYAVSNPAGYDRQGVLAVVADGMGGLSNGGAISAAVVRTFMDTFRALQAPPGEALLEAAARTNERVNKMLQGGEKGGSTLVAVIIREGWLNFLSVGDSRIYLYRGGALLQLNREHAYREELAVRAVSREVPMDRIRGDRQSHALTSFFGIGTIPYIDRNDEAIRLLPGDRLLLASDGVFGTLTGRQLEKALALEIGESAKQIESMISQANLPHQDNNTAVILELKG